MGSTIDHSIDWAAPLPRVLHATAVTVDTKCVLFVGPSGSGKSSLALQMMAFGAELVSDDLVALRKEGGRIVAASPALDDSPFGIEAYGFGLLSAQAACPANLCAIVDLTQVENQRLPAPRFVRIDGCRIRLYKRVESAAFGAILMQFLRCGALEE